MSRVAVYMFLMVESLLLCSCSQKFDRADVESNGICCSDRMPVVALFSFVDAANENVRLGPLRLIGTDDETTFCTMVAPFASHHVGALSLHRGVSDERVVVMYAAGRGFSLPHPACWRFYTISERPEKECGLMLEINYSYKFDDAMGSGWVEGMERLPLCGFPDAVPVKLSDETLPFSVICIFIRDFSTSFNSSFNTSYI